MVDSGAGGPAAKRNWVVLFYFYLAALVGLGFVITGLTMGLLGAKNALFPGLGLPRYTYEQPFYPGDLANKPTPPTDQQLQEAKARAIGERRSGGLDGMLDGLIFAGVGTPVLIWHLKRARKLTSGT
ncbi:MAG: hypothetical protein ACRDRX_08220 [Pseudonocardiaceae bacterium]